MLLSTVLCCIVSSDHHVCQKCEWKQKRSFFQLHFESQMKQHVTHRVGMLWKILDLSIIKGKKKKQEGNVIVNTND